MLNKNQIIALMLGASSLCGCTDTHNQEPSDPGQGAEDFAIVFGAYADPDESLTRSETPLPADREFAVNIRKTLPDNRTVTVMSRYKVANDGSGWYYAGIDGQYVHYWDLTSTQYDFFGVLPYEAATSTSSDVDMTLLLVGNSAPTALNNVYAAMTHRTSSPLSDVDVLNSGNTFSTPIKFSAGVPLHFHPQMCNVVFNLQHTKLFDVQITSIYITTNTTNNPNGLLYSQRLKADGTREASAYRSEMGGRKWVPNYVMERGENPDPVSDPVKIFETRQIAQDFNTSFDFDIQIQTLEVGVSRVYKVHIDTGHAKWAGGKTYIYNLTLNPDTENPISFATQVLDWEYGGDYDKTVIDW